jgi:hypothetical protein
MFHDQNRADTDFEAELAKARSEFRACGLHLTIPMTIDPSQAAKTTLW